MNSTELSELEQARQKLVEQVPFLMGYLDVVSIGDRLISEDLWTAHIYSGDALFLAQENEAIHYFIPEEGAPMWIDCLAIPRDAQNKNIAETFINYILEGKVSAVAVFLLILWISGVLGQYLMCPLKAVLGSQLDRF